MSGTRKYGVTAAIATNAIASVTGVSFSGRSAEIIDVTQHRTGADVIKNLREKLGGLVDNGQVTVTCNYIKNDVGQEYARDNLGVSAALVVTYSDGATVTATGPISEASPAEADGTEGQMTFSFTVDINTIAFAEA